VPAVKGLVFDLSIPKYVLAKGVGGLYPKVHYGRGSCLSLRELASPTLPGPDWVRLRPVLSGLCGSYVYGPERFRGEHKHTFDLVLELLARREGPDPSLLVTHTFPLARYQEAIEANLVRGRYQSVKTVFDLTVNP
jgi:threonine dehydrogenase-like Zn-dependent dehydrogenase